MGCRDNDGGHYHILNFCQYLRVPYMSNICQVTFDICLRYRGDGCWVNTHAVVTRDLFCGKGGGRIKQCDMRRQWRKRKKGTLWKLTMNIKDLLYCAQQSHSKRAVKIIWIKLYDSTISSPGTKNPHFQNSHSALICLVLQASETRLSVLKAKNVNIKAVRLLQYFAS